MVFCTGRACQEGGEWDAGIVTCLENCSDGSTLQLSPKSPLRVSLSRMAFHTLHVFPGPYSCKYSCHVCSNDLAKMLDLVPETTGIGQLL